MLLRSRLSAAIRLPLLLGAALASLLVSGCARRAERAESPYPLLTASKGPVGSFFTLRAGPQELHLLFPEAETLSLKMDILGSGRDNQPMEVLDTQFLDRIQRTQELEPLFGNHFYALLGREQQVFYLDQEREDRWILKWLHRSDRTEAWTIDVLPPHGRILAAWSDPQGRMRLFLQSGEALLAGSSPRFSSFERVLEPFEAEGEASVLDGTGEAGFTVFNRLSGRLLLIRQEEGKALVRPLLRVGRIHHSWLALQGTLAVLTYDPQRAELVAWRETVPGQGLQSLPVAPCRGTHSVFGFTTAAGDWYLFNEVLGGEAGERVHQVSLLSPGASGYRKLALLRSREPILRMQALREGGRLIVAFSQEVLRVLEVDLSRLEPPSSGS